MSIYRRALSHYGLRNQLMMLVEECLELALSVCHHLRGRKEWKEVAEEVEDVRIVCGQVRTVDMEMARVWHKMKLRRLKARMDDEQAQAIDLIRESEDVYASTLPRPGVEL